MVATGSVGDIRNTSSRTLPDENCVNTTFGRHTSSHIATTHVLGPAKPLGAPPFRSHDLPGVLRLAQFAECLTPSSMSLMSSSGVTPDVPLSIHNNTESTVYLHDALGHSCDTNLIVGMPLFFNSVIEHVVTQQHIQCTSIHLRRARDLSSRSLRLCLG